MRHAEEVECLRLALPPLLPVHLCKPTELNEPGLVRVQFKAEAGQPLAEVPEETLRIAFVLEAAHEIICVADNDRVASGTLFAPCVLEPVIKHIVQIDVRCYRLWEPYDYGNPRCLDRCFSTS